MDHTEFKQLSELGLTSPSMHMSLQRWVFQSITCTAIDDKIWTTKRKHARETQKYFNTI